MNYIHLNRYRIFTAKSAYYALPVGFLPHSYSYTDL